MTNIILQGKPDAENLNARLNEERCASDSTRVGLSESSGTKPGHGSLFCCKACSLLFLVLTVQSFAIGTFASEVLLLHDNVKDFSNDGEFLGFGKGSAYATSWVQLDGHGYWTTPPDAIVSGYDYVIPTGRTLRSPSRTGVDIFNGDRLILRDGGKLVTYSRNNCLLNFKTLRVEGANSSVSAYTGASDERSVTDKNHAILDCAVEIGSYELEIKSGDNRNTGLEIRGDVSSTVAGSFHLAGMTKNFLPDSDVCSTSLLNVRIRPRLALLGDNDGFNGVVRIDDRSRLILGDSGLSNANSSIVSKEAEAAGDAAVIASSAATVNPLVANLVLGKNTLLQIPVDPVTAKSGVCNVTGSLSYSAPIQIALDEMPAEVKFYEIPVLVLKNGAEGELEEGDFSFAGILGSSGMSSALDFKGFSVRVNETGDRVLYAVLAPVVTQRYAMTGGDGKIYPRTWAEETKYTKDEVDYYFWSDNGPIGPNKIYKSGVGLRLPGTTGMVATNEFPGSALILDGTATMTWGSPLPAESLVCEIEDFRLSDEATLGLYAAGTGRRIYSTLRGRLTVLGSANINFSNNINFGLNLESKIVGAADSAVIIKEPTGDRTAARYNLADVRFNCDASDFFGTVEVPMNCIFSATSFPGKLRTLSGATVRALDATTVARIDTGSLAENTEIEVACDPANGCAGCLDFMNACAISGRIRIRPEGSFNAFAGNVYSVPVLRIPSSAAKLAIENIQLDDCAMENVGNRNVFLTIVDDGTWQSVVLTVKKRGLILLVK